MTKGDWSLDDSRNALFGKSRFYPLSFDIGEEYHILVRRKTRGEPTFCLLLRDKSPSASPLEGYP